LAAYDAGERALGVDLTRRMTALEVDLQQSTVRRLNNKKDVERWMRRLMQNSCQIFCQVELMRERDRTFLLDLQPNDMRSIVEKIDAMSELPNPLDWEAEKEFDDEPALYDSDQPSNRSKKFSKQKLSVSKTICNRRQKGTVEVPRRSAYLRHWRTQSVLGRIVPHPSHLTRPLRRV